MPHQALDTGARQSLFKRIGFMRAGLRPSRPWHALRLLHQRRRRLKGSPKTQASLRPLKVRPHVVNEQSRRLQWLGMGSPPRLLQWLEMGSPRLLQGFGMGYSPGREPEAWQSQAVLIML
ncbi:unnamed protein product [Amoebophrya sp. A25]|nr:unnamed protein product [Amoebophrya sp. A25]|eukprot:GSA25T00001581001.1